MWIVYILLYLLGMAITAGIFGYFNADIEDNPGVIFGTLFWPALLVIMIVIIPIMIPYEIGQWANKYKDQIDLKSYFKGKFCK